MEALGLFFIVLPCLAIISFACSAACRAQRHKVFKVMAYACQTLGVVSALIVAGVVVWLFTL